MKRSARPTKKEKREVEAKESFARLCKVVDRLRRDNTPFPTPFERAASLLLLLYKEDAPSDEVTDAALAMVQIAASGQDLSIDDTINSLVGICADEVRRDAMRSTIDDGLAHRLRLLFNHLPTDQTTIARSVEFDQALARLASEAT
jgi:hypothetical protein